MAGEADNSDYWDTLAKGVQTATLVPAPPAFGGYVAVPRNHGDADLFAYWGDGSLAVWSPELGEWRTHPSPDYVTLFPASVATPSREPRDTTPFVTAAPNATVGEGPRPLADQPRPDDADDTAYPRRRGRDD